MTFEQRVKMALGEQAFNLLLMATQLEDAKSQIEKMSSEKEIAKANVEGGQD